jgi:SAM-dependent methyltransferase
MSSGFYRAFEDRYRGSRTMIRSRLTVYLPFVQPLVQPNAVAIDLGCGRGEWLELLGEAGFAAEGVDLDEGMLAACRERGLKVMNGDALAALRARPEASVAVVSAFHLVEHISFDQVQILITEALRVLQPGGLLVLETPNPENLVVGASSFYDDPSHLRPLPPKLLAFAVEHSGFARHNVLRLQEAKYLHGAAPVQLFDVLAGVSPDYAVVAQKDGAPVQLDALAPLFAATYGVDLHVLAQRYQQGQDAVRDELGQVRDQHAAASLAVQLQLTGVDAQMSHVHATTVALAAQLEQLESNQAGLAAAAAEIATRLERIDANQADATARSRQLEATQGDTALQLSQVLAAQTAQAERRALDDAAQVRVSERLRSRVAQLQEVHEDAAGESARLAQHVAWVEGRLSHAEAETAALRQQVAELLRRRAGLGVRVAHVIRSGRRRLAARGTDQPLPQPARALLRRVIQGVLRRPAFKRVARRLVSHFPRLHTRLLQLMYAPTPADFASPVDADPLALEMSPRSLSIYRALRGISEHKD